MSALYACICGRPMGDEHGLAHQQGDELVKEGPKRTSSSLKKVFITRSFDTDAIGELKKGGNISVDIWNSESVISREQLLSDVVGASVILCTISDVIDAEVLDAAGPNLALVCCMAADFSPVDVAACQRRNVEVQCVADVCAEASAEMTCALLLITARRVMEGHNEVRAGEWGPWQPMHLCGIEMTGRTLGILGFGRVGLGVATRMQPFGLSRVIYFDKDAHPLAGAVDAEKVEIEDVFREADFIVCTLPLTPETHKIVDCEKLKLCKPECIFINTARGGLVDHDDLYMALVSRTITGAGLDVTDPEPLPPTHPLLSLPNCVVTPHLGTATTRTRHKMAVAMITAAINKLD